MTVKAKVITAVSAIVVGLLVGWYAETMTDSLIAAIVAAVPVMGGVVFAGIVLPPLTRIEAD